MADFGHFWANFMHVVHKVKFAIFCTKPKKIAIIIIYYMCFVMGLCLAAEGDTADRESVVPAETVRGVDAA